MNKLAFCFLLYDKIEHLDIWEEFFCKENNEDKFNIYSHVKKITKETPDWIKSHKVRTVKTAWCAEGLIHAFNSMLKEAIQDKNNKYFILLSGACIPLYNFNEIYKKIFSSSKSRMNIRNKIVLNDYPELMKADQWIILNRKVAKDYLRLSDKTDNKAMKYIRDMRKKYKESGITIYSDKVAKEDGFLGGCPDEVYPINWFKELYGKKFSKYILNKKIVHFIYGLFSKLYKLKIYVKLSVNI